MKAPRVSLRVDDLLAASLANLRGRDVRKEHSCPHSHRFGEEESMAKILNLILEEAVFALEDFEAVHGYIPRQPHFEVTVAEPRRFERVREMAQVERALAAAGLSAKEEAP